MTSVVFLPWIGSRYRSSKVRLLIVGESHYGDPAEDLSRSTIMVVEKWKTREWAIRYLVAAGRVLSGLKAWELDRDTVLEEVAWYNFVQRTMETAAHRPTALDLQEAATAILDVLPVLDPTHILVTGKLVWDSLPPFTHQVEDISLGGKNFEIGNYATPSGRALVMQIPHLSRAFSPPVWHPVVSDFLQLGNLTERSSSSGALAGTQSD